MARCLIISAVVSVCIAQAVLPAVVGADTLYRGEVPTNRLPTQKPKVENPADYDVYFDPNPTYQGPLVAAPLLELAKAPAKYQPEPQRYEPAPQRYEPAPQQYGPAPQQYAPAQPQYAPAQPQYAPAQPQYAPVKPEKKYVPKPFVPRDRKKITKLQPAGPVLYAKPESKYQQYGAPEVQDLSSVPGVAGKDYPTYTVAPETSFTCDQVPYRPGLYADVDAGCQAYHICEEDNRHGYSGATFLCTNGTVFNQYELTCDWWYNVDCASAKKQYDVNLDPYKNPYLPTPEQEAERKAAAAKYGAAPAKYAPTPAKYAPAAPQYSYGPGFGPY